MEAKRPKPATLARYGLTLAAWEAILERQGGVCAVCETLPKSGRLCVDHAHVPEWKHQAPEVRVKSVRGLLCFRCNLYYCGRGITAKRAFNLLVYLENFAMLAALVVLASAGCATMQPMSCGQARVYDRMTRSTAPIAPLVCVEDDPTQPAGGPAVIGR